MMMSRFLPLAFNKFNKTSNNKAISVVCCLLITLPFDIMCCWLINKLLIKCNLSKANEEHEPIARKFTLFSVSQIIRIQWNLYSFTRNSRIWWYNDGIIHLFYLHFLTILTRTWKQNTIFRSSKSVNGAHVWSQLCGLNQTNLVNLNLNEWNGNVNDLT